jgi:hypothetical protein
MRTRQRTRKSPSAARAAAKRKFGASAARPIVVPLRSIALNRHPRAVKARMSQVGAYSRSENQARRRWRPPGWRVVTYPPSPESFLNDAAASAAATYGRLAAAANFGDAATALAATRPDQATPQDVTVEDAGGAKHLHLGHAGVNLGHKLADSTTKSLVYQMVHSTWEPALAPGRADSLYGWAHSLTGDRARASDIVSLLQSGSTETDANRKAEHAQLATHLAAGGKRNLRWVHAGMNQLIGHGYDSNRGATGRMTPFSQSIADTTENLHTLGVGISAGMAAAAVTPTRFHGRSLSSSRAARGGGSVVPMFRSIATEAAKADAKRRKKA